MWCGGETGTTHAESTMVCWKSRVTMSPLMRDPEDTLREACHHTDTTRTQGPGHVHSLQSAHQTAPPGQLRTMRPIALAMRSSRNPSLTDSPRLESGMNTCARTTQAHEAGWLVLAGEWQARHPPRTPACPCVALAARCTAVSSCSSRRGQARSWALAACPRSATFGQSPRVLIRKQPHERQRYTRGGWACVAVWRWWRGRGLTCE